LIAVWSSAGRAWGAPASAAAAQPDEDGDGVADSADRCPRDAGLPPDGCPPSDEDGDEVLDRADSCPKLPGPKVNGGCPDRDQDGDGVVDRLDRCVAEYGHPDFHGCQAPDEDGDAVADPEDRCPSKPEVWNGVHDSDGCPDRGAPLIRVADGRIRFPRATGFGSDGRTLSLRWRREIKIAAAALRAAHTRTVRLVVVAEYGLSYGDSLQRARRRAEAIRPALSAATGFAPDQIEIVCPGPDGKPRIEIEYR